MIQRVIKLENNLIKNTNPRHESKINLIIKRVTESIENFEYPKAIVSLIQAIDYFSDGMTKENYKSLLKLISPFAPHISEEMWEKVGGKGFISLASWPEIDEKKIDMNLEKIEENFEKTISDITNILKILKDKENKEAEKIYLYATPNEINNYSAEDLKKRLNKQVFVFAVNDKKKYDPEGKSSKAKPGKPGIYIE